VENDIKADNTSVLRNRINKRGRANASLHVPARVLCFGQFRGVVEFVGAAKFSWRLGVGDESTHVAAGTGRPMHWARGSLIVAPCQDGPDICRMSYSLASLGASPPRSGLLICRLGAWNRLFRIPQRGEDENKQNTSGPVRTPQISVYKPPFASSISHHALYFSLFRALSLSLSFPLSSSLAASFLTLCPASCLKASLPKSKLRHPHFRTPPVASPSNDMKVRLKDTKTDFADLSLPSAVPNPAIPPFLSLSFLFLRFSF